MPRPKPPTYRIEWRWDFEEGITLYDLVAATTAPRAIAKFKRQMKAEYANYNDIRIIAAYPTAQER